MKSLPRRLWRICWVLLLLLWVGTGAWHVFKPLPTGLHVTGPEVAVAPGSLHFLSDIASVNHFGDAEIQRHIHAATLALVRDAQEFLLLDYFLFNDSGGPAGALRYEQGLTPVSAELIAAVRELRRRQPRLPVLVLTDPLNDFYRGSAPPALAALTQLGVQVVVTDLDALRDSNPLYSSAWRLGVRWWAEPRGEGNWPNPLAAAGPRIPFGALTRLPNFKANHRKVALTGDGAGSLVGIVSSGNPHDASSAHSNVALQIHGEALRPLLESELDIARFSGWRGTGFAAFDHLAAPARVTSRDPDATTVAIATEGAIRDQLLDRFDSTRRGDAIDVAQFYLSDRGVIEALLAAAGRGVAIRVLLDPNKDAFGFEKSGIPNRQVASELISASDSGIRLRWYRTHGEQFHVKLAAVRRDGRLWFTLGSANFTRRNLDDYNLEANALVETPADGALAREIGSWFDQLWSNHPGGTEYSADADVYAEPGFLRYWLYRFMEATGLSTF
ncbi:MAG: phospholipase D-like domain-containing protein [Steroidobacteraceae bacterium]